MDMDALKKKKRRSSVIFEVPLHCRTHLFLYLCTKWKNILSLADGSGSVTELDVSWSSRDAHTLLKVATGEDGPCNTTKATSRSINNKCRCVLKSQKWYFVFRGRGAREESLSNCTMFVWFYLSSLKQTRGLGMKAVQCIHIASRYRCLSCYQKSIWMEIQIWDCKLSDP